MLTLFLTIETKFRLSSRQLLPQSHNYCYSHLNVLQKRLFELDMIPLFSLSWHDHPSASSCPPGLLFPATTLRRLQFSYSPEVHVSPRWRPREQTGHAIVVSLRLLLFLLVPQLIPVHFHLMWVRSRLSLYSTDNNTREPPFDAILTSTLIQIQWALQFLLLLFLLLLLSSLTIFYSPALFR